MVIKLIPIAFLLATCQHLSTNNQASKSNFEQFNSFYSSFTSDSTFQLSRVIFPLKGARYFFSDTFKTDSTLWTKDKWEFNRANIYQLDSAKFKTKILVQESGVKENIWIENSGFMMERHYKQINGKWYLVYYLLSEL